ncbi:MAG: prepilin-type N-terminal cleavage/methylation domain-containing protein, partial [Gemmatimonadaceae bacterium]|nr:prepilin-type N-terminal cleavage/methylation domain-containing protein [Gemmatimonadaceae bacterium]
MRALTRARRGATLAELLVALALSSVVAGAALGVLRRQLRHTTAVITARDAEATVLTSWHLLAQDIRSAVPVVEAAHGIVAVRDSALELWAVRGVAVVCDTSAGTVTIVSPSTGDVRAAEWPGTPRAGDRLLHRRAAALTAPASDAWQLADLVDDEGGAPCPAPPGLPSAAGLRWRIAG